MSELVPGYMKADLDRLTQAVRALREQVYADALSIPPHKEAAEYVAWSMRYELWLEQLGSCWVPEDYCYIREAYRNAFRMYTDQYNRWRETLSAVGFDVKGDEIPDPERAEDSWLGDVKWIALAALGLAGLYYLGPSLRRSLARSET